MHSNLFDVLCKTLDPDYGHPLWVSSEGVSGNLNPQSFFRVQHCCFVRECVGFRCCRFKKSYLFDYFCRQITIWFKLYFSISVDLWLSLDLPTYLWLRSHTKGCFLNHHLHHPCSCVCVYESIYVLLLSTHGFDYYLSWWCSLFEGRKHWGFYYVHGKHLRLSLVRWRGISPPLTDTQKLEYNTFWKAY